MQNVERTDGAAPAPTPLTALDYINRALAFFDPGCSEKGSHGKCLAYLHEDHSPQVFHELSWAKSMLESPRPTTGAAPSAKMEQAYEEIIGAVNDRMLNPMQRREFILSSLRGVLAHPVEERTIEVADPHIPKGFTRLEAFTNGKTIVILGSVPDEDDVPDEEIRHNCDAMGCGLGDHVIAKIPDPRGEQTKTGPAVLGMQGHHVMCSKGSGPRSECHICKSFDQVGAPEEAPSPAPSGMAWTKETPKEPGDYWCRYINLLQGPSERYLVKIQMYPDAVTMTDCRGRTQKLHEWESSREFAGPLPEPREAPQSKPMEPAPAPNEYWVTLETLNRVSLIDIMLEAGRAQGFASKLSAHMLDAFAKAIRAHFAKLAPKALSVEEFFKSAEGGSQT